MTIEAALDITTATIENAFRDAEFKNDEARLSVLHDFAYGELLSMWCEINEFDYDSVRNELLKKLNKKRVKRPYTRGIHPHSIQVAQYKNGELIAVYDSTRDAARAIGGEASAISKAARGKYKSAYGFKWVSVPSPTAKTRVKTVYNREGEW